MSFRVRNQSLVNKWQNFSLQPNTISKAPCPKFFMSSTLYFNTREIESMKRTLSTSTSPPPAPKKTNYHVPPKKESYDEIFKSMEGWANDNVLPLLKPAKECWQPQDLLPQAWSCGFGDQVRELQERAKELPDDYFVVLVGNMVTEEALPSYHSMINGTEIFHDETGCDGSPWAKWARGWSAEENRHGDLLNKYLYLSGRVDMNQVETTIHYLISAGLDLGTSNSPYLWTLYTSLQERQTAIIHGNTARMAKQYGEANLARICGTIAADEKRHESAYTKIAGKLFELDPDGMLVALAYMMRRFDMPSLLMHDGRDDNLYKHLSQVTVRLGVFGPSDHIALLEYFASKWKVDKLVGLSSEGREAQDYICGLVRKIKLIHERGSSKTDAPKVSFSWIFGREI